MYKNGLSYIGVILLMLLTHLSMLGIVLVRGSYDSVADVLLLAGVVLGLDFLYIIVTLCYKQMTYTLDFLLIGILNMSLIFQSCFGGVSLSKKHLLTIIASLVCCQLGFLLTRNHEWIRRQKKYVYGVIGFLVLCILFLTGGRSMWINIGSFSLQPSEFIKPCFILIAAASIVELHKKIKILFFYVSKDTLCLCGMTVIIFGLQWWCRDLGSLPTFAAIFVCALFCRLCYPRAKLSKTAIIIFCIGGAILAAVAWMLAPSYVQDRLHVDIWADRDGNGWQQCEALIGIARGGWLGLGPGQGRLHKVFAYESDIVFATICEEWGLLTGVLMVILILLMLTTVLINPPKSYYHATMSAGIVAAFVAQMALNIFGACNMIPFTGVTLPFISQGGSSMVTCGFLIGMLKAGQSPLFRHKETEHARHQPKRTPPRSTPPASAGKPRSTGTRSAAPAGRTSGTRPSAASGRSGSTRTATRAYTPVRTAAPSDRERRGRS